MPRRPVRLVGWLAGVGIGAALLVMIAASLIRPAWVDPPVPMPRVGPPWQLTSVHVSPELVTIALWVGALFALGGLVAGLIAARRGASGPLRLIFVAAAVTVVLLTVLPPVGSTDALDYAAYGRILVLGHNPYLVTPIYLRLTEPVFGQSIPAQWQYAVSLYGPAATFEQYVAARLGGASMARVVFWLKFWNAVGFAAVAVVLDRVLRSRPAARLRAHLLWTINPLLLWDLMAAGHVDVLAAAAGVIGLLIVGRQPADGRPWRPTVWRALAAGGLIGLAADIKIDYLLFGVALAWALRRSVPALGAAACGAFVVLVPTYAWLGRPAFQALFNRGDETTEDSPWRSADLTHWKYLVVVAVVVFVMVAALLLWRLPPGDPRRPAIRPAVAFSLAFLLVWPYQLPWYDAMIISVLVLYPASVIDWLVLAKLAAATIANIPGDPNGPPSPHLYRFDTEVVHGMAPVVLLAVSAAAVVIAVTGWWGVVRN
jgi:Glycosyltransferase family 87